MKRAALVLLALLFATAAATTSVLDVDADDDALSTMAAAASDSLVDYDQLAADTTANEATQFERRWFGKKKVTAASVTPSKFYYPVGQEKNGVRCGKGWYVAQGYRSKRGHQGEDWNGAKSGGCAAGCDCDMGWPIYAIANGVVTESHDVGGGWGNIIRIAHPVAGGSTVEAVYAHSKKRMVKKGDQVAAGQQIATVGKAPSASGGVCAHLHLELRTTLGLPLGGGYTRSALAGFTDPRKFIKRHGPC